MRKKKLDSRSSQFPIREWVGSDGETRYALDPEVLAVMEELRGEGVAEPRMEDYRRFASEIKSGKRPRTQRLLDLITTFDAQQRENGYQEVT